ncbi:unnamed protein product, partial [Mesorhabditis belari]|uniref:Uncharacterized protein n=1 Tax=Mesorhabditis belari TaxID=2138241 RepID=A0AAF3FKN4_9BILA
MGGQTSVHAPPDMLDHHHQYPDMNMIFKGIPKMIQVADDMHRMTNYIMDLRNMTIILIIISAIGIVGFLIIRAASRNNQKRRRRSIRAEEGMMAAYPPGPYPRYFYPGYPPAVDTWDRPKSTFSHHSNHADQLEEKKPVDSRNSPETAKLNGHVGSSTYKSFSQDDSVLAMDQSEKKLPSLLTNSTPSDVPAYRAPTGAHKRPLESVKLIVEDLPYADSENKY